MASVYDLKPRFQNALRPQLERLAGAGITANQVTLAALGLSALHGLWIASGLLVSVALVMLPVTLFARMALNAIDGMLAREHGQKSRLGGLLNEMCDVIADAALYLPIALAPGVPSILAVAVVTIGLIAEYAGAIGPLIGANRRYDGPFGKSDRALYFGTFGVLFGIGLLGPQLAHLWLIAGLGLGALCCFNRMRRALAEASQLKGSTDG